MNKPLVIMVGADLLIKNYGNGSGFKEWDADPRFVKFLTGSSG